MRAADDRYKLGDNGGEVQGQGLPSAQSDVIFGLVCRSRDGRVPGQGTSVGQASVVTK